MEAQGRAFFSHNTYLLAGALLQMPAHMDKGGDDDVLLQQPSGNILPTPRRGGRSASPDEYKGRKPAAPCSAVVDDLSDELIMVLTALK